MTAAGIISSDRNRAIVGMGVTGQSVARFLKSKGKPFSIFDTRHEPPGIEVLKTVYPESDIHLGPLSVDSFYGVDEVILSPGLSSNEGVFPALRERGIRVIGDIELFSEAADAPIVAITGSNAKSTVTTLVGEMAKAAGMKAGVGGNLGTPALDLLDPSAEIYVLELSSFQLEVTERLNASVACILNLSQDHMDRYADMLSYHRAKQRVYAGAKHVVCNRADALTMPLLEQGQTVSTFGVECPDLNQFGLIKKDGGTWIACGVDCLIKADELAIKGRHNTINAISALAIGSAAGIPLEAMCEALKTFSGLPHRCETLRVIGDVQWIDDSKATNTGAVVAALEGLATDRNIILIAGGQAKGQDFSALAESIVRHVKQLVLIGEDAAQIAHAVDVSAEEQCAAVYAVSMQAAVEAAASAADSGDIVLLSPACASFDMFEDYQARGKQFAQAVEALQ